MNRNSFIRFIYQKYPFNKGKYHLHKLACAQSRGFVLARDEYGHRMLLDLDNLIDTDIYLRGSYEREYLNLLATWAHSYAPVQFIDIGANIGAYSIFLADHEAVNSIQAFEPDPKNFAHLIANVHLNDMADKITAHNIALSSRNGTADFFLARRIADNEEGKFNTGTSSLDFESNRHEQSNRVSVATRTADDFLKFSNKNLLIKIDVEGHEYDVLKGMKQTFAANNCLILIEVWRQYEDKVQRVESIMQELGYIRQKLPLLSDTDNRLYLKEKFSFK
jgi:FkbM family methyltransferase